MKKNLITAFILTLFCFNTSHAQLPDGSAAPDFTLTDIEGNTHRLYDYLNEGKTVYLDFFACHCPYCWAYHNTGYVNNLYNQYGIEGGSDEIMVLGIELDENNGNNEFYGISGNTQGNWVAGSTYPLINPEGSAYTQIVSDYQAVLYPLIYAICPDGTLTNIGKKTTEELYAHHSNCAAAGGIGEWEDLASSLIFQNSPLSITVKSSLAAHHLLDFTIFDICGKTVQQEKINATEQEISLLNGLNGVYFIQLKSPSGATFVRRIFIQS